MKYADLHKLSEDQRIKVIGESTEAGNFVGVLVDADPEKVERYIRKMRDRHPSVRLVEQVAGPTSGVVTLKFGPRLSA